MDEYGEEQAYANGQAEQGAEYDDGATGYYDEDGNYVEGAYEEGYVDGYEGYHQPGWGEEATPAVGMYSEGQPTCCKSFMTSIYPLMVTIIVLNVALLVLGSFLLGVGVEILFGGRSQVAGFSELEGVISSAPFVFAIVSAIVGSLLIFFSILGMAISKSMAVGNPWGFLRMCYFCYQSFLILVVLICLATCIFAIVGLSKVQGDDRYSSNGWIAQVREDPMATCRQQYAMDCAGYEDTSCTSALSVGTPVDYCPGRLCVDYCMVSSSEPPQDPTVCEPCLRQHAANPGFFETCKTFEFARAVDGCQDNFNSFLSNTFTRVVILCALSGVLAVVAIVFSSWKSCSCCQ